MQVGLIAIAAKRVFRLQSEPKMQWDNGAPIAAESLTSRHRETIAADHERNGVPPTLGEGERASRLRSMLQRPVSLALFPLINSIGSPFGSSKMDKTNTRFIANARFIAND